MQITWVCHESTHHRSTQERQKAHATARLGASHSYYIDRPPGKKNPTQTWRNVHPKTAGQGEPGFSTISKRIRVDSLHEVSRCCDLPHKFSDKEGCRCCRKPPRNANAAAEEYRRLKGTQPAPPLLRDGFHPESTPTILETISSTVPDLKRKAADRPPPLLLVPRTTSLYTVCIAPKPPNLSTKKKRKDKKEKKKEPPPQGKLTND